MKISNIAGISAVFEFIFSNWIIPVSVFIALFMLFTVLFKGFKRGYKLLIFALIVEGLCFTGWIFTKFSQKNVIEIIDFCIIWGPTILFGFIILTSTLVNAKRGLRKSLVLLLHSVCAGGVCLAFYFVCIKAPAADELTLRFVNLIAGESGLQTALGVSADCDTLREVFIAYLPTVISGSSDIGILLSENAAYIYTLADMAYRLVFAAVSAVLYFVLVFILYLIYHMAYSERKYRRRKNESFRNNETDSPYKKRHLGGGAVGLVRGVTVGLLSLSFIGSALFIVAGTGDGKFKDYDFADDNADFAYRIYRSIESYGTQGIFKVLNAFTDVNDTPYYLFAADLILSGEITDDENGISENVSLREELGAYTGFARDTFNLLMKYGEEDLLPVINGAAESGFDCVLKVMKNPQFQTEFDDLINEFDSKTYIINFAGALANSIAANIDDMSFAQDVPETNRELIKIIFKKGYLSYALPDERMLIEKYGGQQAKGKDIRPYLSAAQMINKDDARIMLNIAFSFISEDAEEKDTLETVKELMPQVQKLSMLGDNRKPQVDPVLGRIYCWIENEYLTAEGEDGTSYKDIAAENVLWAEEIQTLCGAAQNIIRLYGNVYREEAEALDILFSVFDKENADYAENIAYYDAVCSAAANSRVLGKALSTSYFYNTVYNALLQVSENIYIKKDIVYENVYDAGGKLVRRGEAFNVLYGLKALGGNGELLKTLLNADGDTDVSEIIKSISAAAAVKDGFGYTLSDYLTKSSLLRAVISALMTDNGKDTLYVPRSSLEKNEYGSYVNLINENELKLLLDNTEVFAEFVTPFVEGNYLDTLDSFLENEEFLKLLEESRIFEGTASNLLKIKLMNNPTVILPQKLVYDTNYWVTDGINTGELRNLIAALKATKLPLAEIMQGKLEKQEIYDCILSVTADGLKAVFKSDIMHYTVSNYLSDGIYEAEGLMLVIPASAKQNLKDDALKSVIKKKELISLFGEFSSLGISGGTDFSEILVKLAKNRRTLTESKIISASIAHTVANNADLSSLLSLPQKYIDAGQRSALEQFDSGNPWSAELSRLLDALDEILNLSEADGDFVISQDAFDKAVSELLTSLNKASAVKPSSTRLRVCYSSEIIRGSITREIDRALDGAIEESVIAQTKTGGYYRVTELEALSDAFDIFGLDIKELDGDTLRERVSDKIFLLNEPLESYGGRSTLNVVYPSVIISSIFTKELDGALGADLISADVLKQIKRGQSVYPEEEIADFVSALNELGISDLSDLEAYNFSDISQFTAPSQNEPDKTKLSVILNSDIAGGVLTLAVQKTMSGSGFLRDHPRAYRQDIKIYRKSEIECIAEILDGAELEGYEPDVAKAGQYICDESGYTRSFLMTAAVSESFINGNKFIIPQSCTDGYGIIYPHEIKPVIDAYLALKDEYGDTDFDEWGGEDLMLPDKEVREIMFGSIILRAKISYQLERTSAAAVCARAERIERETTVKGNSVYILGEEELRALSDALDICSGDGRFDIPEFTVEQVGGYTADDLDTLFESDIIRFSICDCVLSNPAVNAYMILKGIRADEERALDLKTYTEGIKKVLTAEKIKEILQELSELTAN
ncbi:MAG: hypothetical protein K2L42_04470 [Clostridia bacterium]|nr:hypothetical protein [Clostridia bacterium]